MSLKKKLFFTNLMALVIPVLLIVFITVIFSAILFTMEVNLGYQDSFSPNNIKTLFDNTISFLRDNPKAIHYIIIWSVLCVLSIVLTNFIITRSLSKNILEPTNDLKYASNKIRSGDYNFELLGSKYEEIAELCQAIDSLRIGLKESRETTKKAEEEKSMLLAHLSHDLKTPITSIRGYAEGIIDGVASTPQKQKEYLETILSKIDILENLVQNLSEYSHLELSKDEFKFQVSDASDFLRELCAEYTNDFERNGISIQANIPNEKYLINADFDKLFRVFSNIFDNAIKYKKADSTRLIVSLTSENDGIYITVADDGIGIPDGKQNEVFDNFYRVNTARTMNVKGNGLGLGIAKLITEKHGGKIWLRKNEMNGTSAIIYLPLYNERKKINETNTNS